MNNKYIFIILAIITILLFVFGNNPSPKWITQMGGAANINDDLLDLNPTVN